MSPDDQRRYGLSLQYGDAGYHPEDDPCPPPVTDRLERVEQREYASWLTLKDMPFVWHSTAKRSTANLGTPDFIVGVAGVTLWVEFKRVGFKLSADQEKFRQRLEKQRIFLYVCHTGFEAIKLTKSFMPSDDPGQTSADVRLEQPPSIRVGIDFSGLPDPDRLLEG